ncbi:MAG: short-chain dehydrogenase [Marinilabiliales bacterium]|nr:MAG: short-chain dehydrogenase [Marinilabiliales bacterium]
MVRRKRKTYKYFKEYKFSNVFAMIRNNRRKPKTTEELFTGKTVVITGATSGIGKLVAKEYASKGANLICVNRNEEKSLDLKKEIEADFNVKCDYFIADLSSMEDTHNVADLLAGLNTNLDVIIHNAGVFLTKRELTADGIEKVFMVHYLSSFIINYKLKEKLIAQDKARIILVNSEGHRFAAWGLRLDDLNWEKRRYTGLKSYGSAKLAQLLSMLVFHKHFENTGVTIIAMHPGAVKSETGKENGRFYKWYKKNVIDRTLKPASISSDALYYLGVKDEIEEYGGKFFNLTKLEEPTPPALDFEVAEELWDITLKMAKLVKDE